MRKIKNYGFDFISTLPLVYLVEGSRDGMLNKKHIVFHVGEDPKTYKEVLVSRDSASGKKQLMMK